MRSLFVVISVKEESDYKKNIILGNLIGDSVKNLLFFYLPTFAKTSSLFLENYFMLLSEL